MIYKEIEIDTERFRYRDKTDIQRDLDRETRMIYREI